MVKGRVSVVIPSRNEPYLHATIDGLLANAVGDIEIIACLDGWWPNPPLRDDKRIRILRFPEIERVINVGTRHEKLIKEGVGMRPCENAAIAVATGEFVMKLDAHCIVAPGFDDALKRSCEPGDLVVPTRHSLDPVTWTVKPRSFNYHVLTYPFDCSMYGLGMHAVTFDWRGNKDVNEARKAIAIDDLMSFQGSCWFQRTADFERLGPLDHEHYYFYQEAQEVGLRVWMSGGRCLINKNTWYAHMHKGHDQGRGFYLSQSGKRRSERFAVDYWVNDRMPGATRTFVSFVERFMPLLREVTDPKYQWPADWQDFEKHRRAFEARPPEQIPAHT